MTTSATLLVIALLLPQQPTGQPAQDAPAATTQPAAIPPRNPTQSEIYRELLQEEERPTRILPTNPARSEAAATPDRARSLRNSNLILEGTLVVDRPGRLLRGESGSLFRFAASDDARLAQPMELNKNGLLEAMEREAEMGGDEFFVTAKVTRYRGENYLTLLKYRRQVPHGNLSP